MPKSFYPLTTSDILAELKTCLKIVTDRLPQDGTDLELQAMSEILDRCQRAQAMTIPAPGTMELPVERVAQILYKFCLKEGPGDSVKLLIDTLTDAHQRGIELGRQGVKKDE